MLNKAFQKLYDTQEGDEILSPLVVVAIAAVVPTPNVTTCGPHSLYHCDLANQSLVQSEFGAPNCPVRALQFYH